MFAACSIKLCATDPELASGVTLKVTLRGLDIRDVVGQHPTVIGVLIAMGTKPHIDAIVQKQEARTLKVLDKSRETTPFWLASPMPLMVALISTGPPGFSCPLSRSVSPSGDRISRAQYCP